jgi:hypothetical protein
MDWSDTYASKGGFQGNVTGRKISSAILCSKYPLGDTNFYWSKFDDLADKTINVTNNSNIYIKDTDYTDIATFKAAMSGVMLYYELATPEVTDISDILSVDNYIEVEGGGSLTFENEYKYDVPSEVVYQLKEETA